MSTHPSASKPQEVRKVRLRLGQLCSGMVLAEPIYTPGGVLLGAAGLALTVTFIANLRKLPPGAVREPIVVASSDHG